MMGAYLLRDKLLSISISALSAWQTNYFELVAKKKHEIVVLFDRFGRFDCVYTQQKYVLYLL